jgi:hypothetical protein
MSEDTSIHCNICCAHLESERERSILICLECRRYGLLNGCWPLAHEIPKSLNNDAVTHVTVRAI